MTRRDTIIIATLVNAGLLACLFVTATRQEEFIPDAYQERYEVATNDPIHTKKNENYYENNRDELLTSKTIHSGRSQQEDVDLALKEFLPDNSFGQNFSENEIGFESDLNPELVKEVSSRPTLYNPVQTSSYNTPLQMGVFDGKMVEVKVKKGDMLAKIAKANGTTVKAIKEANHLLNDHLKVGQVLKVPTGTVSMTANNSSSQSAPSDTLMKGNDNAQYYIVQSGDNPWKIAKKFHVKFEDILKLNSMTEEKAKNLKVGQEIRVK